MKKVQTLALALALVALGSVSWAAPSVNSSRRMQKKPPATDSIALNSSRSNIYRAKVTRLNATDKTFAVEVNFSAKAVSLPKKEDQVEITYTQNPGEPPAATTIKSSKSISSERARPESGDYGVVGKVTQVNAKNKTFTVEVTFSTKNLKDTFPEVGKIYDIAFTQPTPGGPLEAINLNSSKSNIY